MNCEAKFNEYREKINAALDAAINNDNSLYSKIFDAMKYSLDAGGKRIRPVLVLEFARIFGVSEDMAMPFAVALEMIHTYSLIHDDLPCMDDDDLRRGRPTNHKMFGEAVAVLAGDALLNRAFEHILTECKDFSSEITLKALGCLAKASGANGMIGGQVIDMEGEKRSLNVTEIEQLQDMKTGALIKAGALIGCILGQASDDDIAAAKDYAANIGLAFQIKDDILNVEGDAIIMGKDVGNDETSGKSTFVKLLGMDMCKKKVDELTKKAVLSAKKLPECEFLVWLAYMLLGRNK
ncbi:MAG: polyprenyl synthetase family protein [Oscillospiraceae bacterium]|nr:polyprenyl synthetase family protein [Oscillospiraceae bacterium]